MSIRPWKNIVRTPDGVEGDAAAGALIGVAH